MPRPRRDGSVRQMTLNHNPAPKDNRGLRQGKIDLLPKQSSRPWHNQALPKVDRHSRQWAQDNQHRQRQ